MANKRKSRTLEGILAVMQEYLNSHTEYKRMKCNRTAKGFQHTIAEKLNYQEHATENLIKNLGRE